MLLVHLLQCQRPESAIIVSRERRGFYAMVDLVEELFAVYVSERIARDELRAVGNLAKNCMRSAINAFTRSGICLWKKRARRQRAGTLRPCDCFSLKQMRLSGHLS